jgi:hypothetical protein
MHNSRTVIAGLILFVLAGLAVWTFLKPGEIAEQSTPSAGVASANAVASAAQATAPRETAHAAMSKTTATSLATHAQDVSARLDLRTIQLPDLAGGKEDREDRGVRSGQVVR